MSGHPECRERHAPPAVHEAQHTICRAHHLFLRLYLSLRLDWDRYPFQKKDYCYVAVVAKFEGVVVVASRLFKLRENCAWSFVARLVSQVRQHLGARLHRELSGGCQLASTDQ